jgi:hypothetical protein
MATSIRAHELPPTTLPTRAKHEMCLDHVNGLCTLGDSCDKDHTLCIIQQDAAKPTIRAKIPNVLSLNRRSSLVDFERDAPAHLAKNGARHDNDFLWIKDIKILPTTDEILAPRAPYVPHKGPGASHRLTGFSRHIDCLFRHLRADNVEKLKDVCYDAAQSLASNPRPRDLEPLRQTPCSTRYFQFHDVQFEGLLHHHIKGILVRVSFLCPPFMVGRKIHKTSHFETGMMAALVGLDADDSNLSVTFFDVYLCESTDSINKISGKVPRGMKFV